MKNKERLFDRYDDNNVRHIVQGSKQECQHNVRVPSEACSYSWNPHADKHNLVRTTLLCRHTQQIGKSIALFAAVALLISA